MFKETFHIFGVEVQARVLLMSFLFVTAPPALTMLWGFFFDSQREAVFGARLEIVISGLVGVGIMVHSGFSLLKLGSSLVEPDRMLETWQNAIRRLIYALTIIFMGFLMIFGIQILVIVAQ